MNLVKIGCYVHVHCVLSRKSQVWALAICASKLQHYGKRMILTEDHKRIGDQFLKLSEKCHLHIHA
ncbi:DUF6626 family protein [Candidatus Enterovibrio altilux]|uniref:DUF6626 family protein n=1 Tax=Candidatus Enterovibrio altilux TaxID=1927128 RepID=UPI00374356D9